MEYATNVNSEEELLGLKKEGKISESEYAELLSAMRKSAPKPAEPAELPDERTSKQRLGKIAFYLMLAGIAVPTIIFLIAFAGTGGGEGDAVLSVCAVLCALLELPAFVLGVIAWPDAFAKATVAAIGVMLVLLILFLA